MSIGVLFPGQGSQYVGMGADLFDARPDLLGERADDTLGWSLRDLCLNGPETELTRTEHAQPAIFALSYALWDSWAQHGLQPSGAAGHSLGEYTALAASEVLSFEAALALVAARGRAMARAADREPSGMAALLGAERETAEAVVAANAGVGGRLTIANLNAPGQIVLAGSSGDIEWLGVNARDLGVRRAVPLNVAGAFHSEFMEPAARDVAEALSSVDLSASTFPVWSNTTAAPHSKADLKRLLALQVVSPVRFSESLADMGEAGISTFIHVGPGDVTAGMARRCVPESDVLVVSALDHIPAALDALGTMANQE